MSQDNLLNALSNKPIARPSPIKALVEELQRRRLPKLRGDLGMPMPTAERRDSDRGDWRPERARGRRVLRSQVMYVNNFEMRNLFYELWPFATHSLYSKQ